MKGTKHAEWLSGPRPGRPTNVLPFLAASSHRRQCGPAELAVALRQVHAAGLRGGFVLVVPGSAGPDGDLRSRNGTLSSPDPHGWRRLCDRIVEQTPLRVALLGVEPHRESPSTARGCREKRCVVLSGSGFPRGRRSVLLELARAVCSGDPGLLAEARAMGVPAFEPHQLLAASRDGTLTGLLEHPVARTLPASA